MTKFNPYFFIKTSDLNKAKKHLKKQYEIKYENTKLTTFKQEPVTKIIIKNQAILNKARHAIHEREILTYEADIKPPMRFMMDLDLKGTIELDGDYETSE